MDIFYVFLAFSAVVVAGFAYSVFCLIAAGLAARKGSRG